MTFLNDRVGQKHYSQEFVSFRGLGSASCGNPYGNPTPYKGGKGRAGGGPGAEV